MNQSYVYLFPMKDRSTFKIGKSINPSSRFSQLLKYYDLDKDRSTLFLCDSEQVSFTIESIIHKSFQQNKCFFEYDGGTEFFNYSVHEDVLKMFEILSSQYNLLKSPFPKNIKIECSQSCIELLLIKIGNSIKRKRVNLNISQSQLGNITGITRQTIASIENGNSGPSISSVLSILEVLKMTDIFDNLYHNETNLNCRAKQTL